MLYVLFLRFQLYPAKKKKIKLSDYSLKKLRSREQKQKKSEKASRKGKKSDKKAQKSKKSTEKTKDEKLSFGDTISLTRMIISVIRVAAKRFIQYLRVRIDALRIQVSADDAAETALLYGAAAQSVSYLFTFLNECLSVRCKKPDSVGVWANFTCEGFAADIDITFSIRVWQIAAIMLSQIVRLIKKTIGGNINGKQT